MADVVKREKTGGLLSGLNLESINPLHVMKKCASKKKLLN